MDGIPYGRQQITDDDIFEVVKTLKSDYLTQGPRVKEFEEKFADYIGSKYAVAVANGTAALHLSVLALGIKPGDKVITTPITFVATANCVLFAGGRVLFADIDPDTYLLDINKVEDILKTEKNVKGIIPVDFAGYPVNLEEYQYLAEKYNVWILEDACHAPGGYFVDKSGKIQFCGNGNHSDLAIFSFHPVKHIATGEGGMITTNNQELFEKVAQLRTHGITKDAEKMSENHGGWYYEMQELGFNYRLSDIHAALGTSQLSRAQQGLRRRQEIADRYNSQFYKTSLILPTVKSGVRHAWHLYIIQTQKRKELFDYLKKNQIFAQVHYIPAHLQPYYFKFGWRKGDLPLAENYYEKCLSLPIFTSLAEDEQDMIINKIREFLNE